MIRKAIRPLAATLIALALTVALTVSWTMTTAVMLTATTVALIMGGTSVPSPGPGYRAAMTDSYIDPFFGTNIAPGNQITVTTPEEFWPATGSLTFDESVAQGVVNLGQAIEDHEGDTMYVFGYSQSTRIAMLTKRNLIAAAQEQGGEFEDYPDVSLAMLADVNKPNGGILERFSPLGGVPFIGITFDGATPTNSPENPDVEGDYALDTMDYSFVHDGYSDFPVYVFNVLAVANAIAGISMLHNRYLSLADISPTSPDFFYQGSHGDTDYYMIRTDIVPILQPFGQILPRPILLFLDEPLRVLIEDAYERGVSPGTPTTFGLVPFRLPIGLVVNFLLSIPVGIDDAAEAMGLGRPLSTEPSGPFGVGGPTGPIPDPTATSSQVTQVDESADAADQADPESAALAADATSDAGLQEVVEESTNDDPLSTTSEQEAAATPEEDATMGDDETSSPGEETAAISDEEQESTSAEDASNSDPATRQDPLQANDADASSPTPVAATADHGGEESPAAAADREAA